MEILRRSRCALASSGKNDGNTETGRHKQSPTLMQPFHAMTTTVNAKEQRGVGAKCHDFLSHNSYIEFAICHSLLRISGIPIRNCSGLSTATTSSWNSAVDSRWGGKRGPAMINLSSRLWFVSSNGSFPITCIDNNKQTTLCLKNYPTLKGNSSIVRIDSDDIWHN